MGHRITITSTTLVSMLCMGVFVLVVLFPSVLVSSFNSPIATVTRSGSFLLPIRNVRTTTTRTLGSSSVPEWTTLDDADADEEQQPRRESNDLMIPAAVNNSDVDDDDDEENTAAHEYAALAAGTAVRVQVGDLSLARKAWKKRRRSGSPLLVPCSVLSVHRESMVRWNILYLLHKYGQSQKDGITLSIPELMKRHRQHLKSSLLKHADALGYEGLPKLLEGLFSKETQYTFGVQLLKSNDISSNDDVDGENNDYYLKAPISKFRAQKKAARAALLQVTTPEDKSDDVGADLDQMVMDHTGTLLYRPSEGVGYKWIPLSAAIRVNQKDDVDTGHIQSGSIHQATIFDYDLVKDGGSPLLTLSLNPLSARAPRRGSAGQLGVNPHNLKFEPIHNPKHKLEDLKMGNGPFPARVIRLGRGMAFVDFGVGRKINTTGGNSADINNSNELVKVHGMLRFEDAVMAPSQEDELDSIFFNAEEIASSGSVSSSSPPTTTTRRPKFLRVGDQIDIRQISNETVATVVRDNGFFYSGEEC